MSRLMPIAPKSKSTITMLPIQPVFPAGRLPDQRGAPRASVIKMRDVSRHKSMDVLQAYVRDADLFRDHAGAGLLRLSGFWFRCRCGQIGQ
jgi:hypothetical protein